MNPTPQHYQRLLEITRRFAGLAPLLARVSLGGMFLAAGWGKLHNLDGVTEFFTELGIALPGFNAHLVATTELAGGAALLLGLGTRLFSLPLAITMVVAILTARLEDVSGILDLVALEEFTYLAVLVWLALAGGGSVSLDALVARRAAPHDDSIDGELATES